MVTFVCIFASWLHLACGMSRATTTRVLKFIRIIIHTLLDHSLISPLVQHDDVLPRLPSDVRTAISHLSLEPRIVRYICCPKCFHPYSFEDRAEFCMWKESPKSRICGEELWAIRSTRSGPKAVPQRLYATQDFTSWLEYFLSRPGIEDVIDASYNHTPSPSGVMSDIWDSPAWLSLGSFTRTNGSLTFSFFIDWFNPFMNKIAGKTVSCGAIMMFCLNLPYHLRHKPENTFFAGITPPPHEPSVTTITSLLDPLVAQFREYYHGKLVRTHHHRAGAIKRVAILPAIGDLPAIRKALGFAGVASHHMCTFCDIRKLDIEELDTSRWKARIGVNVIAAAEKWRQASTKKQRKVIFDKYGVRWSSLHQLSYRDPVQHTVLGIMHNWMEGILQHHVRTKWGIGMDEGSQTKGQESWNPSNDDSDVEMLDAEILELQKDSQMNEDIPLHTHRLQASHSMLELSVDDQASDDSDFLSPNISDEESTGESEFPSSTCIFNAACLSQIRECITNSTLPSWIDRPPHNLGEKSHGKLKADHWFTLFTIFFPLILPEIWSTQSTSRSEKLLDNLHDLVTCTHIVGSYTTSIEMAQIFNDHYFRYRESSHRLFPNVTSRPNHHFAMHIPDLLCFWGPLIKLSEFPYERHNGLLQSINTNKHMCESTQSISRSKN